MLKMFQRATVKKNERALLLRNGSFDRVLHSGTGDPKFRPAPLLVQYVEAGWVGKKAGRGFYDWTGPEPVPTR